MHTIMAIKHTPSVNIARDQKRDIVYLPTPNAMRIARQISADVETGARAFNVIGSYGTGKSSFLWALGQTLTGRKQYFDMDLGKDSKVVVFNMVAEFCSVSQYFADYFEVEHGGDHPEQIFAEIYDRYHALGGKKPLLVLMLDEFGKFLEYAAKNNPEKELYFLQQLAEFVNNPDYDILLLTTLHQNFDVYAHSLQQAQRFEWTKVKGRFKEVPFNEPVEHLLNLAGERLSQSDEWGKAPKSLEKIIKSFNETKALSFSNTTELAQKIFPLDPFAGSVLVLALQRYGQNERSLFTFLESQDYTGLRGYDRRSNPFFNLSNAYDFLIFNFYGYLNAPMNQDKQSWSSIQSSLERAENEIEELIVECIKLLKTIGLLNLFASAGSKLDMEFLVEYAKSCLGLKHPELALQQLIDRKIILYRKYARRFVPFEGTDLDIQGELLRAGNRLGEISDISTLLNKSFRFQPVFAKQYYYQIGTPRVFEFVISQLPKTDLIPRGETDGYVNLIFNDQLSESDVQKASKAGEAVLYGYYRNAKEIRELLFEIERTKKALESVPIEDRVARRELHNIQIHQESLMNHHIQHNLYTSKGEVAWYFDGRPLTIESKREFNVQLTLICKKVYPDTPVFKNELVNRTKLSSQIQTAKGAFIKNLVQNWHLPELGFSNDKFPPEKTIYLTLLKGNGLISNHETSENSLLFSEHNSFRKVWEASETFLESARKNRRRISELTEILSKRPFKLKQGLIDFWLPAFLFLKRDEFALFGSTGYIPNLSADSLDLVVRKPSDFEIKKFDLIGIRLDIFNAYRQYLSQREFDKVSNPVFVETIRPFLTFYRNLPDYAKHTKRLQRESLAIRAVISTATDPENTFFEDFPAALGTNTTELKTSQTALEAYIAALQESIRELRGCYDELVNRFEAFLLSEIMYQSLSFEQYKEQLQERFHDIKQHLLLSHQKTFFLRLSSELDEREPWLSSLAQAVIGKPMKQFRDEDEPMLYDKFKSLIHELDTLTGLSKTSVNEENEEVFGLEITTFEHIEKKIVRFPKNKKAEIDRLEEVLKKQLGTDKTLNIAALASVLKDLLKNKLN